MNDATDGTRTSNAGQLPPRFRHPLVIAVAALVWVEALALAAATVFLVIEILVAPSDSFASAVALAAVAAIGAVWVGVVAVNIARGFAWTRGAAIVVQILLGAIAIGSLQGIAAVPAVGVALLVPAVLVLVLLFSRPVVATTTRRDH